MVREWIQHDERKEYMDIECSPPGATLAPNNYNTWNGFWWQMEPVFALNDTEQEEFNKLLYLLEDVMLNLVGNEQKHLDWFKGWIGQMLLEPGKPPGAVILIKGTKKTGKTFFFENFLKNLIHWSFDDTSNDRFMVRSHVNDNNLGSQFATNSLFADKMMCVLDETSFKEDHLEFFKGIVEKETVYVEPKKENPKEKKFYCRLVATSNFEEMATVDSSNVKMVLFSSGNRIGQQSEHFQGKECNLRKTLLPNKKYMQHMALHFKQKALSVQEIKNTLPVTAAMAGRDDYPILLKFLAWLSDADLYQRKKGTTMPEVKSYMGAGLMAQWQQYLRDTRGEMFKDPVMKNDSLIASNFGKKLKEFLQSNQMLYFQEPGTLEWLWDDSKVRGGSLYVFYLQKMNKYFITFTNSHLLFEDHADPKAKQEDDESNEFYSVFVEEPDKD